MPLEPGQTRIFDWCGPPSSEYLNLRWQESLGNFIFHGLDVVPGTSGMKISITPGAGLVAGLTFIETEPLQDILTLAQGHSTYPRIDAVVAEYTRQEIIPQPPVIYKVLQGTPSPNPQPPAIANNQLLLAYIHVPAAAVIITEEMIQRPLKFRERIQELIYRGVLTLRTQPTYIEGVVWKRDTDPTEDPTCVVEVGDIWCDTSQAPPAYYAWDGASWIDIQDWESIKNRPEVMPPEEHELAGSAHTGDLPISRVSGHTAFGPPAHQEAFALSLLRRP